MKRKNIPQLIIFLVLLAALAVIYIIRLLSPGFQQPEPSPAPTVEEVLWATPEPTAQPTPEPVPTPTPEPTPSPEPTPDPNSPEGRALAAGLPVPPAIDINSWEYTLVNHWNSIDEYEPPLADMGNGQRFDNRASEALTLFMDAARAQGLSVYLSSTYRTYNDQAANFQRKLNQGYDRNTAWTIVALPGTSEHQLGLAADITDRYYELKDSSLENTALYQWMSKNCQDYGFIVRYPKAHSGTSSYDAPQTVTGVIYEPWHFRYVGVEAAKYIMENSICLEQFVALYRDIYSEENPAPES